MLRRPPLGHVLPTAHDMAREHRVLSALADTDVPVARPLALCEDPEVNGAPFYVMEYRAGVVANEHVPEGFATTAEERRAISLALVDVLARLHARRLRGAAASPTSAGPRATSSARCGAGRSSGRSRRSAELPEIDAADPLPARRAPRVAGADPRARRLPARQRRARPADPGRIVAVFDWEMATLGDPLADLGYTLIYWGEAGGSPGGAASRAASRR